MPAVSIILPSYNRADIIQRAVASILGQTYGDFELIVIDDGSTDGTAELLRGADPRIQVLSQANQGCYVARNAGLRHARGRWLTFMDSDDEWLPHFLELTVGFLESAPGEHLVMTEFLEDAGGGPRRRQDRHDVAARLPVMAQRVGSRLVDLPAGETDDYLRVYSTREALWEGGRAIAARAGYPEAALYRGHIFEHLRFGYLGWLPITMLSREAFETVGEFLPQYRSGADYNFLGRLYRRYRANLIEVPSAIKHNLAVGGKQLAQGHLASGAHEYRFAAARLPLYDEFFVRGREGDPELTRIRGLYHWYAGRVAVQLGKRREAMQHLAAACHALPGLWPARLLRGWVWSMPPEAGAQGYMSFLDVEYAVRAVAAGQLSVGEFVRGAARRVVGRRRPGESA